VNGKVVLKRIRGTKDNVTRRAEELIEEGYLIESVKDYRLQTKTRTIVKKEINMFKRFVE